MKSHTFRAVGYPLRLYSGAGALLNLADEVRRKRARRAFIVCGQTVSRKTALIGNIKENLGALCAGVYDAMGKDSPLPAVLAARAAAREAGADILIAVGGGSVIQATRVVTILLAEKGEPHDLITQYPEGRPAVSVRLLEPKLPIINVCTVATSAANRAGSAIKDPDLDHRMEFFDPKTRPCALFWDADALLTAPDWLARNTSLSVYWRAVTNLGDTRGNPLVEGDRLQAFRLAARALPHVTEADNAPARIDMCAAAFLHNRDVDDGGMTVRKHWVGRVVYALATALFIRYPQVSQGEASSALIPTVMRELGARDADAMVQIAAGLGVWSDGMAAEEAPRRAADMLEKYFRSLGLPVRLRDTGIPQDGLRLLVQDSLKNFNADPQREFEREQDVLLEVMRAAW